MHDLFFFLDGHTGCSSNSQKDLYSTFSILSHPVLGHAGHIQMRRQHKRDDMHSVKTVKSRKMCWAGASDHEGKVQWLTSLPLSLSQNMMEWWKITIFKKNAWIINGLHICHKPYILSVLRSRQSPLVLFLGSFPRFSGFLPHKVHKTQDELVIVTCP